MAGTWDGPRPPRPRRRGIARDQDGHAATAGPYGRLAGGRCQGPGATGRQPGRLERAEGGHHSEDGPIFASRAELAVYQILKDLQRESPRAEHDRPVLPLPGARLRDAGVCTPDFAVIGNGRAAVVEADGPEAAD